MNKPTSKGVGLFIFHAPFPVTAQARTVTHVIKVDLGRPEEHRASGGTPKGAVRT
jgi:hypothetical protein